MKKINEQEVITSKQERGLFDSLEAKERFKVLDEYYTLGFYKMAQHKHTSLELQQYLLSRGYHATYWKGDNRGFYNPRNRQTLNVPDKNCTLTENQIIALFRSSEATDLPPQLEWYKFQLFKYSNFKTC